MYKVLLYIKSVFEDILWSLPFCGVQKVGLVGMLVKPLKFQGWLTWRFMWGILGSVSIKTMEIMLLQQNVVNSASRPMGLLFHINFVFMFHSLTIACHWSLCIQFIKGLFKGALISFLNYFPYNIIIRIYINK